MLYSAKHASFLLFVAIFDALDNAIGEFVQLGNKLQSVVAGCSKRPCRHWPLGDPSTEGSALLNLLNRHDCLSSQTSSRKQNWLRLGAVFLFSQRPLAFGLPSTFTAPPY